MRKLMTDKYRPAVATTAAVLESLLAVGAAVAAGRGKTRVLEVVQLTEQAALEAHDCAVDNLLDAERWKKHEKMREVASEYYHALNAADTTSPEEITKLKDRLDILIEPFSDDPAFVAFLQMKRVVAGVVTEGEKCEG